VCGCASSQHNIDTCDLSYVVFLDTLHWFDEGYDESLQVEFPVRLDEIPVELSVDDNLESITVELFRISNNIEITNMLTLLKTTGGTANETFSGTLPSQAFYNSRGELVMTVEIICHDSSIFVTYKGRDGIVNEIDGINRDYVNVVCRLLRQRAPERMKQIEEHHRKHGRCLLDMLKISE